MIPENMFGFARNKKTLRLVPAGVGVMKTEDIYLYLIVTAESIVEAS